jgi:hypothetical protein
MEMLDSVLRNLQTNAVEFRDWWTSIDNTYRAGICLLGSLLLIWSATRASNDMDRQFFLSGIAALALLGYGALLFVHADIIR